MHIRTFEDLAYHELGHAFMNLHYSITIGEVYIYKDTDGKIDGGSGTNFHPKTPEEYQKRLDVLVAGFVAEKQHSGWDTPFQRSRLSDYHSAVEIAEQAYPGTRGIGRNTVLQTHVLKAEEYFSDTSVQDAMTEAVGKLLAKSPTPNDSGTQFWILSAEEIQQIFDSHVSKQAGT